MSESKYAQAGVNFEKEHDVVEVMVKVGRETLKNIQDLEEWGITFPEEGSDFSGSISFDLEALVNKGVKRMVQSGGVDGPGSKPVVHALYNGDNPIKLGCTAIDSIAMCANDVLCSGARPFTILEYHSWHDIDLEVAKQMAQGKLLAAELSKAAIIGGENASLSAMITGPAPKKAYDMCNTVLGLITGRELIDNPLGEGRIKPGDIAIGLSSSGIHCNGVTLVWTTAIDYKNKVYAEAARINQKVASLGESVAEALLTPTIIYVDPVLEMLGFYGSDIHAIANITGEGVHNMRRVLSEGTGLQLDYSNKDVQKPHPIFGWVQEKADIPTREMYEDYNMGTGIVVFASQDTAPDVIKHLNELGQKQTRQEKFSAYKLGNVVEDSERKIKIKIHQGTEKIY